MPPYAEGEGAGGGGKPNSWGRVDIDGSVIEEGFGEYGEDTSENRCGCGGRFGVCRVSPRDIERDISASMDRACEFPVDGTFPCWSAIFLLFLWSVLFSDDLWSIALLAGSGEGEAGGVRVGGCSCQLRWTQSAQNHCLLSLYSEPGGVHSSWKHLLHVLQGTRVLGPALRHFMQ